MMWVLLLRAAGLVLGLHVTPLVLLTTLHSDVALDSPRWVYVEFAIGWAAFVMSWWIG